MQICMCVGRTLQTFHVYFQPPAAWLLFFFCYFFFFFFVFFAGEFKADLILFWRHNTCRLKEAIHLYIWHSLDICACVCSHCIFMCTIIPDGYGPHKSGLILTESLRKSNKAQSHSFQTILLSLARNPDGASLYITA